MSSASPRLTAPLALACAMATGLLAVAGAAAEAPAPPLPQVETRVSPPPQPPAPEPEAPPAGAPPPGGEASAPAPAPAPTSTSTVPAPQAPAPPRVRSRHAQGGSSSAPQPGTGGSAAKQNAEGTQPGAQAPARAGAPAPSPSTLTPGLPFALETSLSGVPGFFAESFRFPPFLLPIYQAAGSAYGVPWQVLAAINEVETDYGRDLSVSSAGAEGWMQFLPAEWQQYGVDANGDGYRDPYNPADAIFAAARYLGAAGAAHDVRAAVFSYNHSQAYVESVMLRAQLLAGSPPELLGAIAGLTEARFPVYAQAHFSDGFPAVAGGRSGASRTLVATTIYSQAGAPVIAAQDGEIAQIGDSPKLGHFVVLKDAFGNTYVYGQLGDVAPLYPVISPRVHSAVSARLATSPREPAPSGPATAGAQPRSPLSQGATVSGLALGATAGLEASGTAPLRPPPAPATAGPPAHRPPARHFTEGSNDVYLHPLRAGVQVIAGTVLGHVGPGHGAAGPAPEPHITFQLRPAGTGAPLIDPKPILDGWVALENSSIFRAKGENPFLATSPTTGQVLLESKQQLEPQVLHDRGVVLGPCGRAVVRAGRMDKRLLATLEYLSVSGLKPAISGVRCPGTGPASSVLNAPASASVVALHITAVNGVPIAGHEGPGSIADTVVRRLLMLQGLSRPLRVTSTMSYPGSRVARTSANAGSAIAVSFAPLRSGRARDALLAPGALSPGGWIKLISRLGEIPDPTVARAPSPAAIPDRPAAGSAAGASQEGNGNH